MKITNIRPGAMEIYKTCGDKTQAPQIERDRQEDRAEISSRGRELQKYRNILKTMSDIRPERVQELKDSLAEGAYQPSAEKIAEMIIVEKHLNNKR